MDAYLFIYIYIYLFIYLFICIQVGLSQVRELIIAAKRWVSAGTTNISSWRL